MVKQPDLSENAIWKQRYRAASITFALIANLEPSRGLVCSDRDGIRQLYAWEVETGQLRQLTDQPAGVVNGTLSADGEFVYYLKDDGGNEIGHFVQVPFSEGEAEDITPEMTPYSSFYIQQSYDGKVLGARLADQRGQMLYLFDQNREARCVYSSQDLFYGPVLSHSGEIAVIASTEGTGSLDTKLIAFDTKTGKKIRELREGESINHDLGVFSPIPGDYWLLSTSSKSGYARPILWNAQTGEWRELGLNGVAGDVHPWCWSKDGKQLLLSQVHQAEQSLFLYELDTDRLSPLAHPDGVFGGNVDNGAFIKDEIWITWQDPAHPPRLIALDRCSGKKVRTILDAGEVPKGKPWQSVFFKTQNGEEIQGWLGLPNGEGPYPTILHTHGGPTSVMNNSFSPESQAWVDHGYAWFTINYHGSTTFGKAFEKSILGNLGELEVEDMAAAYEWLISEGVAKPDGVFLTGGSYGGYLTLQGLGKLPELWAGGMAVVAIADWAMLYEDENESLRGYHRVMFGGTPDETPEAHLKSSPMTYADGIQAPILVIQGKNDTRCPAKQMKVYEAKLRELGKEIKVHWFEAGHGSRAQEQNIEHMTLKLKFASEKIHP